MIDFAAALYGLAKKEAAVQLANDFGLSYEDWKPPGKAKKPKPQQKSPEEQVQEAKNRCFRILADYLHLLMAWRTEYAPHSPEEAFHPRFVEALQKQAHVEYLLDVLLGSRFASSITRTRSRSASASIRRGLTVSIIYYTLFFPKIKDLY